MITATIKTAMKPLTITVTTANLKMYLLRDRHCAKYFIYAYLI